MTYSLHRALMSLSSLSLGTLAASLTLHAMGCGQSVEQLYSTPGRCAGELDDKNPCTEDACLAGVAQHTPAVDGTACMVGKDSGHCAKGNCARDCESMPATCACNSAAECPGSTECLAWSCEAQHCMVVAQVGAHCSVGGKVGFCDARGDCGPCSEVGPDHGCGMNEYCYTTDSGSLTCTHCTNGKQDSGELGADCGGICAQYNVGSLTCGLGAQCSLAAECVSGFCIDGVCCNSSCVDLCTSCSEGSFGAGVCSGVPTGTMDSGCGVEQVCVAGSGGKCLGRAGAACAANDQCISRICASNNCAKGPAGAPCADSTDCSSPLTCDSNHICG